MASIDVILRRQVHLIEEGGMERRTETPLIRVRRAVWRTLCANDAGFVSRTPETNDDNPGSVTIAAFGLTVS